MGATQYIAKMIGERRAKEMVFLCRRYGGREAAQIGLVSIAVPAADLRTKVEAIVTQIRGHGSQTVRATKASLDFDSDSLHPSWQNGIKLLANIWGTEESLEGKMAFMEKRPPDLHQFRVRNKAEMDRYRASFEGRLNQGDAWRAARPAK